MTTKTKLLFPLCGFFCALLLMEPALATVTYYHSDHLNSPIAATNNQGEVIWRARYFPFGDRDTFPAIVANKRWFTGHVHDDELGLSYMQARYYDPVLGRFMSPDPVGFNLANPASFNRYAYANNSPYNFVDPDGRESIAVSLQVNASPGAGGGVAAGLYATVPIFATDAQLDGGAFRSISVIAGADIAASLNIAILRGGRENVEGNSLVTTYGAQIFGVGLELQSILNPDTQKFAGGSIGISAGLPVTASSSFTKTVVASLRDSLQPGQNESVDAASAASDVDAEELLQFYMYAQ